MAHCSPHHIFGASHSPEEGGREEGKEKGTKKVNGGRRSEGDDAMCLIEADRRSYVCLEEQRRSEGRGIHAWEMSTEITMFMCTFT